MTADAAQALQLTLDGREVARYHDGADLAPELSPRPYLHPVRTPAGEILTETWPEDHRHHYGVSAAVVDVNGSTYWGGASYVDGTGYVLLPNQGRQTGSTPEVETAAGRTTLRQRLGWTSAEGVEQIQEDREVRLAAHADAHLLTWRSSLHAMSDLTIGSPATRGRTGAGYGGLFWRVGPAAPTEVRVATADGVVAGEQAALGAVGRWLTLTQHRAGGPVTLLLAQPEDALLPWFVRVSGYVGAGPAVAWERTVPLGQGETWDLHLWAALVDSEIDDATADRLHRDLKDLAA
ncbi:MAG TPA: PmoA family protein [Actinotalea caeni]|uniref:DUF6807 domain-containing protein n=1 Tax=Actinotalea caeni TaxID=1348467 RepID=UPI0012E15348|nr:PmoA family protein [Actinotalea caeni]HLV55716.1 PmoA family protein [Actinotalea caeni]